jgi:hypothetical protein
VAPAWAADSLLPLESSTRHDPGGGGCCAVGSDILEVVIRGEELAARQLSIGEAFLDLSGG